MENSLPKNWLEISVGEFAYTASGGTPSTTNKDYWDGNIPWINSGKLKDGPIIEPSKFITELALKNSSAKVFPKETVVIALTGATTGKVGILKLETSTNQSVTGIWPNKNYNSEFLFYQLIYLRPVILSRALGSAQPHINKRIVDETLIKFPPLAEQHRIVTKIDALFGQLETIKKSLEKVPVLLKNFRQQVLTQAVTGKLNEEWREGKELESIEIERSNLARNFNYFVPNEWKVYAFSDVADIKSNLVNPDEFLDYPLIAPDNIAALSGKLISKPLTSEIRPISGKHFFNGGSIIYSKIRPYLSKVILAEFDGLCSADMYPVQAKFNTKYLLFYMLSEIFLSYANTAGERSVLPKINQKGLNIIPVPMPPLEEQQEIVRRVESLFAKADAIETQYNTLKEKIDKLPQAILHKAFKGELTKQLETDGDARDLLKKIELLKYKVDQKSRKKLQ